MKKYFNYHGEQLDVDQVKDLYFVYTNYSITISRDQAVAMDSLMCQMEEFIEEHGSRDGME